jgi:hypothetical protein
MCHWTYYISSSNGTMIPWSACLYPPVSWWILWKKQQNWCSRSVFRHWLLFGTRLVIFMLKPAPLANTACLQPKCWFLDTLELGRSVLAVGGSLHSEVFKRSARWMCRSINHSHLSTARLLQAACCKRPGYSFLVDLQCCGKLMITGPTAHVW